MGTMTKVGPNMEPATHFDWVAIVDPETGEPAEAGGGAGTSNTTEATQLLVKEAVEGIEAIVATEAKQDDTITALGALTGAVGLEVTQQLVLDELGEQTTHLATLATAAASTDPAAIVFDTATMRAGTTSLTPKYASVAGTGSADLVALVASKKIRVLAYVLVFNAASTAKFQTGATTDLTGAMPFGINGGISAGFNPVGWFETTSGAKLNLVLGTSVAWAGHLVYVEV